MTLATPITFPQPRTVILIPNLTLADAWKVLWTEPKPQLIPRCVTNLDRCSVRQVACGSGHTLALTDGGDVYSWGYGWGGCLGHGKQQYDKVISVAAPTLVKALSDLHIIQVALALTLTLTLILIVTYYPGCLRC